MQNNSTKRTLLKKSIGQVMTENKVIEQLKEKKRKRTSKSSTGIAKKSTSKKCRTATAISMITIVNYDCTFFRAENV